MAEQPVPAKQIFLAAYPAMAVWAGCHIAYLNIMGGGRALNRIQGTPMLYVVAIAVAGTIFAAVAWGVFSIRHLTLGQRKLLFTLVTSFWYVPFLTVGCLNGNPLLWGHLVLWLLFLPASLAFLFFLNVLKKATKVSHSG